MVIPGGTGLVFHVHSCPYAPAAQMQAWWQERFMCVDTTKEQVIYNLYLDFFHRHVQTVPPLFLCLLYPQIDMRL